MSGSEAVGFTDLDVIAVAMGGGGLMGLTVVLADTLHRALSNLDGSERRRVIDFLIKLQTEAHSSGVRLKQIKNPRDPRVRTARVTDDLRAVLVHIGGDAYVVQTVMRHDDAYKYAEQLSCTVNAATGAVEMLETLRIEQKVEKVVAEPKVDDASPPIFAAVSDEDFARLGIPPIVVPALRHVRDEETLLDLTEPLPVLQRDVLLSLVDLHPDDVYRRIVAPAAAGGSAVEDDLAAAFQRPTNQASYLVVTDAAELLDALAWPMDRWRIYLHPTQRSLAYPVKPYSGPVRVTGGPGTGKTVVAVHRAKALADRSSPGDRILVVTYGATLARSVADLLRRLDDTVGQRVEVLTADQLARQIADPNGRLRTLTDMETAGVVRDRLRQSGSALDPDLVKDEWEQIILDQQVSGLTAYRTARRPRRPRLSRPQREAVWAAVQDVETYLNSTGRTTFPLLTVQATAQLTARADKPYRHIIVDEAQDMAPIRWRLLRAAVSSGPDDLFLVGDAHQRIYQVNTVLSHYGINVRGRSRRLVVSYRTTREILRAGLVLMRGHHYDDLDAGHDSLDGYRSLMSGPAPQTRGFRQVDEELNSLARQVTDWRDAGVPLDEIAVGARTRKLAERVVAHLAAHVIPAAFVTGDAGDAVARVHVMTLHRLKGLEYRCVAVVGVGAEQLPPAQALSAAGSDPANRREVFDRERSLLFVACTRAREALSVSWSGEHSQLLAPLIVDASHHRTESS